MKDYPELDTRSLWSEGQLRVAGAPVALARQLAEAFDSASSGIAAPAGSSEAAAARLVGSVRAEYAAAVAAAAVAAAEGAGRESPDPVPILRAALPALQDSLRDIDSMVNGDLSDNDFVFSGSGTNSAPLAAGGGL